MNEPAEKEGRHGTLVGGLIVLGLGIVFLLSNLEIIPDIGRMWPLVLVVIGIALVVGSILRRTPPHS
ncbi:MAG: DUF5668 domain-containing protein [Candidatus Zixiibacteriota bacterium]